VPDSGDGTGAGAWRRGWRCSGVLRAWRCQADVRGTTATVYVPTQPGDSTAGSGLRRSDALLKPSSHRGGCATQGIKFPCPGFYSQGGSQEIHLEEGRQVQGNIWGTGLSFSIISAGEGRFLPQSAVNILCTCRNSTKATSELSAAQLPLPRLCVLADFLFQTSGPCYMSECIIQTSLP